MQGYLSCFLSNRLMLNLWTLWNVRLLLFSFAWQWESFAPDLWPISSKFKPNSWLIMLSYSSVQLFSLLLSGCIEFEADDLKQSLSWLTLHSPHYTSKKASVTILQAVRPEWCYWKKINFFFHNETSVHIPPGGIQKGVWKENAATYYYVMSI